jgi:hypothetical protein
MIYNYFASELFHNKTPSSGVSYYCGLHQTTLQNLVLFTHNLLWLCVTSLLSMRLITLCNTVAKSFYNSIPEWTSVKLSRILKLCLGNFFLEQLILLLTTKALQNHFHLIDYILVPGILKFQNYYPWLHIKQVLLTRMHTILL